MRENMMPTVGVISEPGRDCSLRASKSKQPYRMLVVEHRNSETKGLLSLALSSFGGEGIPTARMYRDFAVTVLGALFAVLFGMAAFAADPTVPPIKALADIKPKEAVFKDASAKKPLVIKTAEEAGKYFAAEQLSELQKKADFKQQMLLIFAWQGSGQDKISYTIAESYPEQIFFNYEMGRTRDLRQHQQLYLLRTNVTWSVK
jgi:hypothetical protein